ncbi:hypothetical protein ACPBEH_00080 [Latilactobacillus sp. 5-91]|uniref:hypothetical protein n=1 Tax=Latilactobacillus sp. 5-91 TaxID=3410924 RepID=UPI003C78779D
MKCLMIKRLDLMIELQDSTINIVGNKNLELKFIEASLAEFWFNSLVTQVESLQDFLL